MLRFNRPPDTGITNFLLVVTAFFLARRSRYESRPIALEETAARPMKECELDQSSV